MALSTFPFFPSASERRAARLTLEQAQTARRLAEALRDQLISHILLETDPSDILPVVRALHKAITHAPQPQSWVSQKVLSEAEGIVATTFLIAHAMQLNHETCAEVTR